MYLLLEMVMFHCHFWCFKNLIQELTNPNGCSWLHWLPLSLHHHFERSVDSEMPGIFCWIFWSHSWISLPETNTAPLKIWWLEDDMSFLGRLICRGELIVSDRVGVLVVWAWGWKRSALLWKRFSFFLQLKQIWWLQKVLWNMYCTVWTESEKGK